MTYRDVITYLYAQHPAYERQGATAYKPGLTTSRALAGLFGNPQNRYAIIHVAGTNGKGSVANMLSACLQQAGYRVGLFTSPHLVDFRERIRVNGKMVTKAFVTGWFRRYQSINQGLEPSFFELTSTMALSYFAHSKVDIAVLEVGLGGRLDSTNIVMPILSVITNIAFDHTDLLGNTLPQIAAEKAGIIKAGVPVVVGESGTDEVRQVFEQVANVEQASIVFADDAPLVQQVVHHDGKLEVTANHFGRFSCDLMGDYQRNNINTVLVAVEKLKTLGYRLDHLTVAQALSHVKALTNFTGRWTVLRKHPLVVCDAAHNPAGVSAIRHQLSTLSCQRLHIVMGMMRDKDIDTLLALWPKQAKYYFAQVFGSRALPSEELCRRASSFGLKGEHFATVEQAYHAALSAAGDNDAIFVGGSMYVMGEVLAIEQKLH